MYKHVFIDPEPSKDQVGPRNKIKHRTMVVHKKDTAVTTIIFGKSIFIIYIL